MKKMRKNAEMLFSIVSKPGMGRNSDNPVRNSKPGTKLPGNSPVMRELRISNREGNSKANLSVSSGGSVVVSCDLSAFNL